MDMDAEWNYSLYPDTNCLFVIFLKKKIIEFRKK